MKGGDEMVKVHLGATIGLPGFSSARVEVEAEHEDYGAAYDEAKRLFYRTAYRHVREVMVGIKSPDVVEWLASQTDEEPA